MVRVPTQTFPTYPLPAREVHSHSGVYFYSRLRCEPVMLCYSMFCLPSTLRAVQGATPSVRLSIKDTQPWGSCIHSIQPKLWSLTLFRESAEAYSHITPRASFRFYIWKYMLESNQLPFRYKRNALPNELIH